MWIAKFKYTHDCILGNRCKKFQVQLQSIGFSIYVEKGRYVNSSLHTMGGSEENMDLFIADLKKDSQVINLERKGSNFFLLEKASRKVAKFMSPKLIFIKPVVMDMQGYETWEIGSWDRDVVSAFIENAKTQVTEFKLLKFSKTSLDDVHFPRLLPELTMKQQNAIKIAITQGYYETPRKIDLRKLAKMSKISLSTYEQHLRVAEQKLIPNLLDYFR